MKSITIFITTLVLSLNVLAIENVEKSKAIMHDRQYARMEGTLIQDSLPVALSADNGINGRAMTQDTSTKQDELLIQLSVYFIIILVYWFYWLKANTLKKTP